MKKLIAPIIICVALMGPLFSCRKVDNPKLPSIAQVPLPFLSDSTGDQSISSADPASFAGIVRVGLFFKGDVTPKKMDLVVAKNGDYSDTGIKVIQADITSFPSLITVHGSDLINLFGSVPVVGDAFTFGVNITLQDGSVYNAFDTLSSPYSADIAAIPGANTSVTYNVVCPFDRSAFVGNYKIVTDQWVDYQPGDAVPSVTIGTGAQSNELTMEVYPSAAAGINRKPMTAIIDTLNPVAGNVTVAPTIIGDYPGFTTNIEVKTVGGGSFVNFCNGTIHLNLDFFNSDVGDAGTYTLEISH